MGIGNLTNVYRYKRIFTGYVPETVLNGIFVWLNLLSWLLVLNIGVAIFNMLPVRPLDGGLIYEEIFKKKFGRKGKKIMRIVELTMLALIIFNLFIMYLIRTFI
jgi:membrane-associated protease RseP (regulator of RpoE activity)